MRLLRANAVIKCLMTLHLLRRLTLTVFTVYLNSGRQLLPDFQLHVKQQLHHGGSVQLTSAHVSHTTPLLLCAAVVRFHSSECKYWCVCIFNSAQRGTWVWLFSGVQHHEWSMRMEMWEQPLLMLGLSLGTGVKLALPSWLFFFSMVQESVRRNAA